VLNLFRKKVLYMDKVEEIKNKLAIEDIVADYIQIKKAGKNFKALCPFHNEKTPSFVISPDKGLAYCFGCHKGGDIFEFVQEIEGIDFFSALKILANKAGVDLEEGKFSKNYEKIKTEKTTLLDIQDKVKNFYKENLSSKEGQKALAYLKDRGLTDATIKSFSIGFALDGFEHTLNFLKKSYQDENILIRSGIIAKNSNGKIYDKFRNRIVFPICNSQGVFIAFTGRVLDDSEPKYLNSPDSPVFHKGRVLFGLHKSKVEIKKKNYAIIVEGQMDVLMSNQAGVNNIVASSGTALTEDHLNILKRLTNNLVLSLDTDKAGIEASFRAIELALRKEMYIEMIDLEKKDPADVIKDNPDEWVLAVKNKKYFLDFLLDLSKERADLSNTKIKKEILSKLLRLVNACQSQVELADMIRKLSLFFKVTELAIKDECLRLSKKDKSISNRNEEVKVKSRKFSRYDFLLAFVLAYPEIAKNFNKELNLMNSEMKIFDKKLYNFIDSNYNFNLNEIKGNKDKKISQEHNNNLLGLDILISEYYEDMTEEELTRELGAIIVNIWKEYKKKRLPNITLEIRIAEENKNKEEIEKLQDELLRLMKL